MNKGFSLIELLITIAIIAFLAMVALPMTSAWIDGPDVTRTQTNFTRAYSLAKNIAIREGTAVPATGATSALCIKTNADGDRSVSVRKQSKAVGEDNRVAADCSDLTPQEKIDHEVFTAELRPDVDIQYGAAGALIDFTCACFTGNGAIADTDSTTNCKAVDDCLDGSVVNNTQFTFNKGSVNETATLF
ncbi:pilus assembly FimT family protein [Marinagarivorans cellulosilyticus]|uniref:Prepilin-type N-terminal cleavage/methylation domain-containing protein n=1 Tax=Marinagarivorans cellulosilyticus TaxID=2721545 RepID=A0AAN1WJ23_9GAMM|nr:prepilin-type N-terminal cleavage/methylation domain-containing protein [Marinagarivorans cellulosilyticus]BCD98541.1 hypothetical protein MARGE09_P2742 [Marinagarivorans cellulosilyticus]